MDPENKATLIGWAQDIINQNKMLFQTPLLLDIEAIAEYVPPVPAMAGQGDGEAVPEPKPGAKTDSAGRRRRLARMDDDELGDLVTRMERLAPPLRQLPPPDPKKGMNGHAKAA